MTGYAESAAASLGFLEPGMGRLTKPVTTIEARATRIRSMIGLARVG